MAAEVARLTREVLLAGFLAAGFAVDVDLLAVVLAAARFAGARLVVVPVGLVLLAVDFAAAAVPVDFFAVARVVLLAAAGLDLLAAVACAAVFAAVLRAGAFLAGVFRVVVLLFF